MKRRLLSALLTLLLTLGALSFGSYASPTELPAPGDDEPSIYIDPEYGVFIADDSDYCDSVPADLAESENAKGTFSLWSLENSVWLDALEYTGYPVQKIHDAGYLFNTDTNGWYGNYTYKLWKGIGTDESAWTFKSYRPKNYAEAISAWSQSNVSGSLARMASVASAGGTEGLFYKGYAPSTITFGSHTSGAGVAYKSGSSAVMEKPSDWKKEYIKTDQGFSVQRGIVCASMATYVYFNYLPTVKSWTKLGINNNWHYKTTSTPVTNAGLRLPYAYNNGSLMVAYNSCTCLDLAFSHSSWASYVDTGTCTNQTQMISALNQAVPGTVLLFRYGEVENGEFITPDPLAHAAVYLGKWNGTHFVLQTASIRGPEIQTVDTRLVRDDPPLLSRYILPPPFLRVKLTSGDKDTLSGVSVTVTYTNPGASAATWTGKSVRRTDRDGKAYGEVLMPMCYLKENASVTVSASKSGVSFPNGNTAKIQKVQHGENLVELTCSQAGKAVITVTASDISSHTYQFTLTNTVTGAVRTAESKPDGTIRVTDDGPCTSDKTAFLLNDGTYRLTEVEPGRFAPAPITVTEVASDGTRTKLGSYSAKVLAQNSSDPKSYTTPAFKTSVLNKGGYLEITVANQHPSIPSGNLTGSDGTHKVPYSRCAAFRDQVTVKNLVPGHVYLLRDYLVDLETGQRLMKDGKVLYFHTGNFTADATQMNLELNFTADTRAYSGKKLAVQEYLFDRTLDMRVTQYPLLDDAARQVTVGTPQTGKVAITVTASDISSHTYQFTLTDTATGKVRTAESKSDGKIRVTDSGASTSDKTAFLLKDGTYRLTEVEPGRFAPAPITVTEVAPDGTKTVLGTYSAKVLAQNSSDPKSYTTPAFKTSVLNEGGYLEITVANQQPSVLSGNLTGSTGTHEVPASRAAAIRDRATVKNLVPGHVYLLRDYLVDLETGKRLMKDGKEIYFHTGNFTATATQMNLEVNFTVDTRAYSGKKLAVQEYLFDRTLDMRVTQYALLTDTARQVLVNPALPIGNPFVDVPDNAWFTDSVLWAWNWEITEGINATHFGPGLICTRAQAVTFLWRANGCPKPKTSTNPFTDVPKNAYYTDAVLWASETGVTNGVSANRFAPNEQVNRAEFVTFLWRAAGKPNPKAGNNPFEDVAADSWYGKAVLWAVERGITKGVTNTSFCPEQVCTRAEVVTFLCRSAQAK